MNEEQNAKFVLIKKGTEKNMYYLNRKRKNKSVEHNLQFTVASYLKLRKFIVIDCDIMDGLKFAQGTLRYPYIVHHKKMGYIKGQPDMIAMKNGKVYCLELKSENGKQSKEQKAYQEMCAKNNIPYIVVRNLEDLRGL